MGLVISLDGNCLDLRQSNKYVSYRRILSAFQINRWTIARQLVLKYAYAISRKRLLHCRERVGVS